MDNIPFRTNTTCIHIVDDVNMILSSNDGVVILHSEYLVDLVLGKLLFMGTQWLRSYKSLVRWHQKGRNYLTLWF